ncbi:hypothetical protein DC3_57630 [Deinococcus cellulosilyticus NBRC 106333 = KACC 11606]|uniref:Uncharacterized protein n=1 Tax=Deinococcus cellulosilyticus (strain DSM 18568 / NBRC 106333 / KACC 11606 / 5516J-15) TaxID=1223518 RepID=A0A511NC98_DEIC1|nr:hypothetical protein DC3_57630 [Deinococcus cellulosilyticus NBRC 106333 = KACC 11606]
MEETQAPGKQPPADVATVLLADSLPVQTLKALKDAGVPLRWAPLGRVFTVPEWGDRAQALLKAFEELTPANPEHF